MPQGAEQGILKGLYLIRQSKTKNKLRVQLLGVVALHAPQNCLGERGVAVYLVDVVSQSHADFPCEFLNANDDALDGPAK